MKSFWYSVDYFSQCNNIPMRNHLLSTLNEKILIMFYGLNFFMGYFLKYFFRRKLFFLLKMTFWHLKLRSSLFFPLYPPSTSRNHRLKGLPSLLKLIGWLVLFGCRDILCQTLLFCHFKCLLSWNFDVFICVSSDVFRVPYIFRLTKYTHIYTIYYFQLIYLMREKAVWINSVFF